MLIRTIGLGIGLGAFLVTAEAAAGPDDRGPFEIQPMVGYSWINLTGFSEDQFLAAAPELTVETAGDAANIDANAQLNAMTDAAQVSVEGQGLSAGLGAQLKFWVFVIGTRYAYTHTSDFGLHGINADLGMRIGDKVALYGRGGLGLVFLSGLPDSLNTQGFSAGVGGGLDVRPNEALSFGIGLDADVLLLASTRQLGAASGVVSGNVDLNTASEIDGSALGFIIRPQIHLTWHL